MLNEFYGQTKAYRKALRKLEQLKQMRDASPPTCDGLPRGNCIGDRTATVAVKVADQEKKVAIAKKAMDQAFKGLSQLLSMIHFADFQYAKILTYRHVFFRDWAEIAKECKCSISKVKADYRRAVEIIEGMGGSGGH